MFQETAKKEIFGRNRRKHLTAQREGFVETPDHQALHYTLYGQGDHTLVLCDGVGCDGYIWKYLIPDLARDYQVLHWQYRGHGQSSTPRDYSTLTILQMVEDLHCILEKLVPQPAVFLGHSMGTQVILEYHRRHPENVKALIPLCGAAGNTLDNFLNSTVFKEVFPYLLQFFRMAPELSGFFWNRVIAHPQGYYPAILLQLTSTLCSKEDLQPYLDHLGRIDARVFMELSRDMGVHNVTNHLGQVNVPTLVFSATRDRFTPLSQSRQIADLIEGSELCLVRGATHTAPLEIPKLFCLRIRKFLKERVLTDEKKD